MKDYIVLGSILGSPCFGKLPYTYMDHLGMIQVMACKVFLTFRHNQLTARIF